MATTAASQWKSKAQPEGIELTLPSENVCKVRPLKPEAFLESGMVPDALSGMVMRAINSKKGLPPKVVEDIAKDPKKLAAAMELFDRALVFCVIEPPVEMPPICQHEGCTATYAGGDGVHVDRKHKDYHRYIDGPRDAEVLYADVVDMEDKQFIFQWAIGGVADVGKFRDELGASVAALQPGQVMEQDTGGTAVG